MNDSMPSFSAKPRQIAFFLYQRVTLLDVAGPLQVFSEANERLGETGYDIHLTSLDGGPVLSDGGVTFDTSPLASLTLGARDTLIASGGDARLEAAGDERLKQHFRAGADACGRVASTCTGAFILAASGLLDGRRAVTHWRRCAELALISPTATIDPEPIFVEDDGVWTSAGVTAGIDMSLAFVEADHDRALALEIARAILVYAKRPGGQAQFSDALKRQTDAADGRFDTLHAWMAANLTADLRVEALAERCHMSPRNFARVYADATGQTPARAVEALRVDAARDQLEQSSDSIKTIAAKVGFGSEERMRRSFTRRYAVSPAAYRDRFAMAQG